MARLAMTSLAFMLDWARAGLPDAQREVVVELPVDDLLGRGGDQVTDRDVQLAKGDVRRAAACFRMPKARTTPRGMVSSPMSKLISERAVWQP